MTTKKTPEQQKRFDAMDMEAGVSHLENNPSRPQANIDTTSALRRGQKAYDKLAKSVQEGDKLQESVGHKIKKLLHLAK